MPTRNVAAPTFMEHNGVKIFEDTYAGGAVLVPWQEISTDDLLKLETYIQKHQHEFE